MLRAAGPVVDPVPCSGCGTLIDPLRAGHVAIFDLRFHYFCDRDRCRAAFLGEAPAPERSARYVAPPSDAIEPEKPADLDTQITDAFEPSPEDEALPEAPAMLEDRLLVEPVGRTILTSERRHLEAPEPRDVGGLLLLIALVAGSLGVALALAGESRFVVLGRLVLAAVGAGMLLGRAATTARDPCDPPPAAALAAPVLGLLVAIWASFGRDHGLAAEAASLAGFLVAAAAVGAWLIDVGNHPNTAERAWVASELTAEGRRVNDAGEVEKEKTFDFRPGEHVLVDRDEVVPVDAVVTSGEVDVLPWLGALTAARRREGDSVVAGARVVQGKLRGTVTFAGYDRAFARVLLDPRRRADVLAPVAKAARLVVTRWAIAGAAFAGLSALVARRSPVEVAMIAVAVHGALAAAVTSSIAAVHVTRGVLLALRRGVVYRSADAWDRAARVAIAVFCARGTLLLGEPELAELETTGAKLGEQDVLALAAGAERSGDHPIARATARAARVRGVRPDGVRNPTSIPGLGVTAVSSTGEALVVGSRSLLLDQRISIASAEQRISELEGIGRTVVLVALGARLVGLLAFQDGLRPGARAAVQHLIDAQIEPVLMSGDARETCEAIGRSLDIDHVRPEVLPQDRAAEVKSLLEAGASVAVFGHPGADDAALAAADVAIALDAAGSATGDYAVCLASNDVRDAALALALAKRTRAEARVGVALSVVPALIGAAAASIGVLPPAYAPIASLLGGAVAVLHARSLARAAS